MFEEIRIYNNKKTLVRIVTPFYHNIDIGIKLYFSAFKKEGDNEYEQSQSFKFSEILTHKKLMTSDRDLLEIVKYSKDFTTYYAEQWEKTTSKFKFKTYDNIILRKN